MIFNSLILWLSLAAGAVEPFEPFGPYYGFWQGNGVYRGTYGPVTATIKKDKDGVLATFTAVKKSKKIVRSSLRITPDGKGCYQALLNSSEVHQANLDFTLCAKDDGRITIHYSGKSVHGYMEMDESMSKLTVRLDGIFKHIECELFRKYGSAKKALKKTVKKSAPDSNPYPVILPIPRE